MRFTSLLVPVLFGKNITAVALWPFILTNPHHTYSKSIESHEKIHLRQQLEMLIIPFYLWYCIEWLVRVIQYKDRHKAYLNISFEREAYTNDKDLFYYKKRKLFGWMKYLW